jgi:hypothetical protein
VFANEADESKRNLFRIRSDFGGEAERLTTSEQGQFVNDISPDGRLIALAQETPGGHLDIFLQTLDDQGKPEGEARLFAGSPALEITPRFSPSGKWIAYVSSESGKFEIYVKASDGSGAAVQISTEVGLHPQWSPTEDKLYFSKSWSIKEIHSVSFSIQEGVFKPELPELVCKVDATNPSPLYLDISPDGKRFLTTVGVNETPDEWTNPRIIVNWFEELKAKVPTN